jgi:septal ring factor EnvC (AmiA/AmiB activator)
MLFKEILKEQLETKDVQALIKSIQAQMNQLVQHISNVETEKVELKKQNEQLSASLKTAQTQQTAKTAITTPQAKTGIGTTKSITSKEVE